MTNINSSPDSLTNVPLTTDEFNSIEKTEGASSAFQPIDDLDSGHVVVQQFLSVSRWGKKEYQADMRHPTLIPPELNEGGTPSPFEPAWQRETHRYFRNLLKEHLLKKIKTGESEVDREVNNILQAISSGKIATLSQEDKKNITEITEKTQKKWSLPNTWSFGTREVKDWTPIKTDLEPPTEVAQARGEIFLENIDHLTVSIEKAGETLLKSVSPKDPGYPAVGDLVKMIAQAISELKQVLQSMQLSESKINAKIAEIKTDQKEENLQKVFHMLKKQKKIQKKQRKQKKIAGVMKVVAPIVTALVAVAAIVFAVASLGTATAPLAIAVAVVSTIMFAYTVVDTQKGYTQEAMEAFNNSMEKIQPKWAQETVKALILAAVVMMLILAVTLSAGAATTAVAAGAATTGTTAATAGTAAATTATTAGTTAATLSATQISKEIALQLTIQTSMMFIMSSNILSNLVIDSCVATGALSRDDQETIMIIQIMIMALTLILCMEAMAQGKGLLGSSATMIKDGTQAALENTQTFVKNMSEATIQSTKTAIEQALAEFNKAMLAILENLWESAKTTYANATWQNFQAGVKDHIVNTMQGLAEIFTNNKNLGDIAHNCENLFKISGLGINAGYSIYLGTISLQLANLFRELGDIEKEKASLEALIALFEKLLTHLQTDQTGKGEWIRNLTQTIDNMYASASIMSTKITQQYTA